MEILRVCCVLMFYVYFVFVMCTQSLTVGSVCCVIVLSGEFGEYLYPHETCITYMNHMNDVWNVWTNFPSPFLHYVPYVSHIQSIFSCFIISCFVKIKSNSG